MEPTPAQRATEPALSSQNESSRVEDNAHCKDDLHSDWICSSRSSKNSAEPLSQISETIQQRQSAVRLAAVKSGQQHKRKASITDLIAGTEDDGKVSILCLYHANSF